jgi:hypothetical protein
VFIISFHYIISNRLRTTDPDFQSQNLKTSVLSLLAFVWQPMPFSTRLIDKEYFSGRHFYGSPKNWLTVICQNVFFAAFVAGVARFYWRKIPKRGKIYQINTKLTKGHRIYQMAVIHILLMSMECTNLFHFKAHRYLYTQIRIFGLKIYYKSGSPDL